MAEMQDWFAWSDAGSRWTSNLTAILRHRRPKQIGDKLVVLLTFRRSEDFRDFDHVSVANMALKILGSGAAH